MTFTDDVRDELAHGPRGRPCCRRTETGVLLRLGGSYQRVGGEPGLGYVLTSPSAAVVRRARATVQELGARSELHVVQPSGLQARLGYRIHVLPPAGDTLVELGLLHGVGTLVSGLLTRQVDAQCDQAAGVRGALLGGASLAAPGHDPHLEVTAPGPACAEDLAALLRAAGADSVRAAAHHDGWRVVVKSAVGIGVLLARAGAHGAFLRWDQERMHRQLRQDATRSANADRANLARTVAAAADQVVALEAVLNRVDWDDLDDELREVALARLANPEASLTELGGLLDPPVGKSTVHRRLGRLLALGRNEQSSG